MSPRFFGVVNENAFWNFNSQRVSILAQTAAAGARTLRQTFDWSLIEKQPGVYSFDFYDQLGWATQGTDSPFTLDESGQAREIGKVFNQLVDRASVLKLRGISYFNWQDAAPYAPAYRDFWGLHTGLLAIDGREKPAYSTFRDSVLRLTGPLSSRR